MSRREEDIIRIVLNSLKAWHECLTKRNPRGAGEKVLIPVRKRTPKRERVRFRNLNLVEAVRCFSAAEKK